MESVIRLWHLSHDFLCRGSPFTGCFHVRRVCVVMCLTIGTVLPASLSSAHAVYPPSFYSEFIMRKHAPDITTQVRLEASFSPASIRQTRGPVYRQVYYFLHPNWRPLPWALSHRATTPSRAWRASGHVLIPTVCCFSRHQTGLPLPGVPPKKAKR